MKTFLSISNQNDEVMLRVGSPKNDRLNLFLSFNPFQYRNFIEALENLTYAEVVKVSAYDDERLKGGIGIRLTEDNSFSKFIQRLPELIYLHVEIATPTDVIHKA